MLNARRTPLVQHRPMKKGKGNPIPPKVRAEVADRSKGWCEVGTYKTPCDPLLRPVGYGPPLLRHRAQDMHHLVKRPRLHHRDVIVHLCRRHHEMCEGAFAKGRLVFTCQLESIAWRIEVRARKGSPLLATLAQGTINLAPLNDGAGSAP